MRRRLHTFVPQKLRKELVSRRKSSRKGSLTSGELYDDIRMLRTSESESELTGHVVDEVIPSPFELSKMSCSMKGLRCILTTETQACGAEDENSHAREMRSIK